jgi:hypothetical protein
VFSCVTQEAVIGQIEGQKAGYITFMLQVSKGSGQGMPNYKKSVRTLEEGDLQQWMDIITRLREIRAQNWIMVPTDMSNTVVALLKGDGLTAYEAPMEDNHTNPNESPYGTHDRQWITSTTHPLQLITMFSHITLSRHRSSG